MQYLILIDYHLFRGARSVEHAALILKDLQPHGHTEVISADGLEWYRWNRERSELIKAEPAWVIHSKSEEGYWNNRDGWGQGLCMATRFTEDEVPRVSLPMARDGDSGWAPVTRSLLEQPL